jgi:hypothetical protein
METAAIILLYVALTAAGITIVANADTIVNEPYNPPSPPLVNGIVHGGTPAGKPAEQLTCADFQYEQAPQSFATVEAAIDADNGVQQANQLGKNVYANVIHYYLRKQIGDLCRGNPSLKPFAVARAKTESWAGSVTPPPGPTSSGGNTGGGSGGGVDNGPGGGGGTPGGGNSGGGTTGGGTTSGGSTGGGTTGGGSTGGGTTGGGTTGGGSTGGGTTGGGSTGGGTTGGP